MTTDGVPQTLDEVEVRAEHLEALYWQTNEQNWHPSANPTHPHVLTKTMSKAQAQEIIDGLNPKLNAKLHESVGTPGKYRVAIEYSNLEKVINANEHLIKFELSLRSASAQRVHGNADIPFAKKDWKQIGADVDFATKQPRYMVSLGSSDSRERLFIDRESTEIKKLYDDIKNECEGKTTEEKLKIVNKKIDEITAPKGSNRQEIERGLDERLAQYLADREAGKIPGKPRNRDVPIDELMEARLLVCRHKGLLAAQMMGALVQDGMLPPGASRQFRSEVQDKNGKLAGAHTWAVYREASNGKLWVNDPRWARVTEADKAQKNGLGYGEKAQRYMFNRLDILDAPMLRAAKVQNNSPPNSPSIPHQDINSPPPAPPIVSPPINGERLQGGIQQAPPVVVQQGPVPPDMVQQAPIQQVPPVPPLSPPPVNHTTDPLPTVGTVDEVQQDMIALLIASPPPNVFTPNARLQLNPHPSVLSTPTTIKDFVAGLEQTGFQAAHNIQSIDKSKMDATNPQVSVTFALDEGKTFKAYAEQASENGGVKISMDKIENKQDREKALEALCKTQVDLLKPGETISVVSTNPDKAFIEQCVDKAMKERAEKDPSFKLPEPNKSSRAHV